MPKHPYLDTGYAVKLRTKPGYCRLYVAEPYLRRLALRRGGSRFVTVPSRGEVVLERELFSAFPFFLIDSDIVAGRRQADSSLQNSYGMRKPIQNTISSVRQA